MQIKELIGSLTANERAVCRFLKSNISLQELVKLTGLQEVEVARALQWLQNKGVVDIEELKEIIVVLGDNGKRYSNTGLPERIILNALKERKLSLTELTKKTGLSQEEINACIGVLRSKAAIETTKEKELMLNITEIGKGLINKRLPEENFIEKLKVHGMDINSIHDLDKLALDNLKKRRDIIKIEDKKERIVRLTELGEELIKQDLSGNLIESLTAEMIKNGSWKNKRFRNYDVKSSVPRLNRGKKHFVTQSIDYIKKIWLEMGFVEMEGDIVQTAFWDLDALFVPQDHPAREMQDTFFIGNPQQMQSIFGTPKASFQGNKIIAKGKLPKISQIVKQVHENGGNTGSKGWGGKWSEELAKEVLLRTHTTVLSAHTLARLRKQDLPAKFFAVNKVYRNEALDWKHLFEFYQVEGIVVDPNANFRNLIGYLKEFYKKMGYEKIRIRPAHFPYTEPSVEVEVLDPVKKEWIELGGAGIFRPEVTKALLGFEVPVLAWGQGMERGIRDYYNITDIRQLYGNDFKLLKDTKEWMR